MEGPLPYSLSPFLRGEGRVRGCIREFALNFSQNALKIPKDVIVPKSKYLVTFLSQTILSQHVCDRFIVLTAVDLDHKAPLTANEVAHITDDRFLPYEFVAVDLPVPDAIPEDCLCVCLIDS